MKDDNQNNGLKSEEEDSKLELNVQTIDAGITTDSIYKEIINGIDIKIKKNSDNSEDKYFAEILSTFCYKGILDDKIQKNIFGYYKYDKDKSEYIGEWKQDKKSGKGIYYYESPSEKELQAYIGEWEDGKRNGKGIYIMSTEEMENYDYTTFIGEFKDNVLLKGIKLKNNLKTNNVDLYSGNFTKEGLLSDEKGIMIEGNKIFYGKVEKEEIQSGIMISIKNKKKPEEPIEIEYAYHLEKNDKRFDFNGNVNETEKEDLFNILGIFLKEEPNDDISKIIEVIKKVKEEVQKEDFFENNDIKTLVNYISSYETISKEKYGITSDIL